MKPTELLQLLQACAEQRLTLLNRHQAVARLVGNLDFNNTYQYVVAREETHLSWLQAALEELGAPTPSASSEIPVPTPSNAGKNANAAAYSGILEDDARHLAAFVERWRPRVATVTHARHRTMLGIVLGESMEHRRLFEQAAAGLEDVIGRRTAGAERVGAVLPTRWQE